MSRRKTQSSSPCAPTLFARSTTDSKSGSDANALVISQIGLLPAFGFAAWAKADLEANGATAASAAALHPNDRKRIVRALEIFKLTGKTKSELDEASRAVPPRWKYVKLALGYADRADLYSRIDARVDDMLARGLAAETQALLDAGVSADATSMQAIGYKELIPALRGEVPMETAAEDIRRASRRYAKRQLSWLRGDAEINEILFDKTPDFARALRVSTDFALAGDIM